MTSCDASTVLVSRAFDDGHPLLLARDPNAPSIHDALLVDTFVCSDPTCKCRDIQLTAFRLEHAGTGVVRAKEGTGGRLNYDMDTGELVPVADGPGGIARSEERLQQLRAMLTDDMVKLLRQRWHRVKACSPDEWRRQDWTKIDRKWLVPYHEAFPSGWDMSTEVPGDKLWLVDMWCLNPDCPCTEFKVQVIGVTQGSIGNARIDLITWKVAGVDGKPLVRQVCEGLLRDSGARKRLKRRWDQMRAIAKQLSPIVTASHSTVQHPIARAVGRNEPCPCGSGRKYKKCCGARAG